jgi:hypothetical protein
VARVATTRCPSNRHRDSWCESGLRTGPIDAKYHTANTRVYKPLLKDLEELEGFSSAFRSRDSLSWSQSLVFLPCPLTCRCSIEPPSRYCSAPEVVSSKTHFHHLTPGGRSHVHSAWRVLACQRLVSSESALGPSVQFRSSFISLTCDSLEFHRRVDLRAYRGNRSYGDR